MYVCVTGDGWGWLKGALTSPGCSAVAWKGKASDHSDIGQNQVPRLVGSFVEEYQEMQNDWWKLDSSEEATVAVILSVRFSF